VVLKWSGREPRKEGYAKQHAWDLAFPHRFELEDLLMHHYVNHTSNINGHKYMREQACQVLVPLAAERPALRFAIMAMSAMHRASLLDEAQTFVPEIPISQLITKSLHHLQSDLIKGDESVLHTIKTLCLCEIYSGQADPAWRIHATGAAAVLRAAPPSKLINQWYRSIEALSAVSNRGSINHVDFNEVKFQDDIIFDMYAGYTPDLNAVFRQIGIARHLPADARHSQGDQLMETVHKMIKRDEQMLKFPTEASLSPREIPQFVGCNIVYQQSALILILRELKDGDPRSERVQCCVRTILDTLENIKPITALSPWALLTTPIFTAGCEAFGNDRNAVRHLLGELYRTLRIKNVLRALEVLEYQWSEVDTEVIGNQLEALDFIPF
jgi:hypothetical protein